MPERRVVELEEQVAHLRKENSQLRETIANHADRIAAISRRIRSARELPVILQVVVEEIGLMLNATRCFIHVEIELQSALTFFEYYADGLTPLAAPPTRKKAMLTSEDDVERSTLALPIMLRHEILGTIGVQRRESQVWTPAEIEIITLVGSALSTLLANARLLLDNEHRAGKVDQLQAMAQIIIEESDTYRIAERLTERAVALIGAEEAMVGLVVGGIVVANQVYRRGRWEPVDLRFGPGEGVFGWVLAQGRPYLSNKGAADSPLTAGAAQELRDRSILAVPICDRQQRVLGVIQLYSQQLFNAEDIDYAQTVARQAAIALERAQLFDEMQQRARALDALLSFSAELNEQLNPEKLIRRVAAHAIALAEASAGLGGLVTPDGDGLYSDGYWFEHHWHDFTFSWNKGEGIGGWVLAHKQPYLSNDCRHDEQVDHRLMERLDLCSAISVPILDADEQMLGFITVFNKAQGHKPFSWTDVSMMEAMANAAAVAIRNSRLFHELETQRSQLRALSAKLVTVFEEERRAIARELHDDVGQALVGIKLSLQLLGRQIPAELTASHEEVNALREQVNQAMEQLQALSRRLRPPTLDELGLEPALRRHALNFEQDTGIIVHFNYNGVQPRLPQHVENACYRIVQEALTNVLRHAQASEVWIQLQQRATEVHLLIEDNGRGFEPERPGGKRLGLVSMQERASMLGGRLNVESHVGIGTTIKAIIPVNGEEVGSDAL